MTRIGMEKDTRPCTACSTISVLHFQREQLQLLQNVSYRIVIPSIHTYHLQPHVTLCVHCHSPSCAPPRCLLCYDHRITATHTVTEHPHIANVSRCIVSIDQFSHVALMFRPIRVVKSKKPKYPIAQPISCAPPDKILLSSWQHHVQALQIGKHNGIIEGRKLQ